MREMKAAGIMLASLFLAGGLAQAATTDYFIITVKTDNPGASAANEFTVPTTGSGYNYHVDLDSNGTWDYAGVTGNTTCVFAAPGTYTIRIGGAFPRIFFSDTGDKAKLLSIDQWGTNAWTSMDWAFSGCVNLTVSATDAPDLSNVTSAWFMFSGAHSFNQPIGHWDVSHITDMTGMFAGASIFNQDLSAWDTRNATYMMQMFYGASAFNQDISGWNTANVQSMEAMFWQAGAFNQPIQTWNTSNVMYMSGMFAFATAFDQDLSNWDTSHVVDMSRMFWGATAFNQNVSNWNTANVKNMREMFRGATTFNKSVAAWNTGSVKDMRSMFQGATAFNRDIGGWNTSAANTMTAMFFGATAFDQDLGAWNVTALLDASSMFSGVKLSLTNYDALLNGWGVQNVQNNVIFDGGDSQYASFTALTRRNALIVNKNWVITDGGWYATPTVTPTVTQTPTITATSTVTPTPTPNATATSTATPRNPLADVDLTGKLFLVYPNPAREQVRFLLNPDRAVQVKIQLANLGGEPVAVVTDLLPAGRGIVSWDCRNAAPGLYIARISFDGKEVGKAKVAVAR